jgi:hypothetical protein
MGWSVEDASGRDRQALVVGRVPAAVATAGFLDQAGLNPVLAEGSAPPQAPAAVVLWRPGLELLERLGLRRPVETAGTPLTALRCAEPPQSWRGDDTGRPPIVVVRRGHLRAVARQHLAGRFRTADRRVTAIQPADSGVRATFEGGIEEPFDAVATTDRSLLPGRDGTAEPTGHWWSFEWPEGVPAPDVATEAWGRRGAAFAVPAGGSVRVDLVATGGTAPGSPLSLAALDEQFGRLSGDLGDALAALDRSALRYRRASCAIPGALCADGVASVGPAARPAIPGGYLGPALAIEDGWVLADTLAYGPAAVDDALAAYADRRRRRLLDVSSALRDDALRARAPADLPRFLRYLCACRTLAFGHLFDSPAEELLRDVPDRL